MTSIPRNGVTSTRVAQAAGSVRVLAYAKYVPPRFSGAGRQAITLARELQALGVELRLVTERTPELRVPYEVDGVRVHPSLPATRSVAPRLGASLRIAWEASRYRAAVFHAHTAFPEASAMGAAVRTLGVASVLKVTLQNADVDCSSRIIGPVHRALLRRQDAIVAISSTIEKELAELGIERSRILRIPNGVDTRRFRPASPEERARARSSFGIETSARVVLYVGILNQRKNVGWLLDQWLDWRRSSTSPSDSLLVLAGPPSDDDSGNLHARVMTLSADSAARVRWLGVVERIEDAYAAADLVVLPSTAEGMPNVVLEAMASGLPTAAADSSGSRELLREPPCVGWLFRQGDRETLHLSLGHLGSPERLALIGVEARRRADELYSITAIARRYAEVYSELAQRALRRRAHPLDVS